MDSMGGLSTTCVLAVVALFELSSECSAADFHTEYPLRTGMLAGHSATPSPLAAPRASLGAPRNPATPARSLAGGRRSALDLSAPSDIKPDGNDSADVPFPSRPHAASLSGSDAPEFHFQGSRLRQFTERFHREGLPVARLWETHSALLSLGLNQRGKPGLWLIQKTH
jgi:hypothetical protein